MPIAARGVVVRSAGAPPVVEEIEVDEPGPGEVRLRISASGVCHTDLHAQQGNFGTDFPYLLGHEACAVVESVGPGVTRPAAGDTVVVAWRAPCGSCRRCSDGRLHACTSPLAAAPRARTVDGLTLGRVLGIGSFATHAVVAAAQAIPVGVDLPAVSASLLGCAVVTGVGAALYAAAIRPGATVAVYGCGAVGVSVVMGARLAHAGRIIAVDLSPGRLEHARRLGASDAIDARHADPVARIRELCGGVDYAFEAVGLPQTLAQAVQSCGTDGVCTLIGVPAPGVTASFSMTRFFYTRATLRATSYGDCVPARDFPLLAQWYRDGKLALDELVTSVIPLEGVEAALAAMQRSEGMRTVVALPPA